MLGALCLCLPLAANGHYGVFRDELYFIACGRRPAFGYVDQPPLVPLIAAASHALFGVALTPLRLMPALAMTTTVALTAKFAEALGGGRYAQWLAGLWRLSTRSAAPELRVFPIAYVVMATIFVASHGKAYCLAALYPTLFAAGAVAFEAWFRWRTPRAVVMGVVVVGGLVTLPIVLPILPPDDLVRYSRALGLAPSRTATERGAQSVLPQYFADMFGWREMAAEVSAVYQALPSADRQRAVFFGRDYGEAAALDIYGPALQGPPAINGHNSYFLWGSKGFDGSVMIMVGGDVAKNRPGVRRHPDLGTHRESLCDALGDRYSDLRPSFAADAVRPDLADAETLRLTASALPRARANGWAEIAGPRPVAHPSIRSPNRAQLVPSNLASCIWRMTL